MATVAGRDDVWAGRPVVAGTAEQHGESPVWCARTNRLWWVDVSPPRLHSYDPTTGCHQVHDLPGRAAGSCMLRSPGGLILALDAALWAFDPAGGQLVELVSPEQDRPLNRLNDGKVDRAGRIWVGSMNGMAFEPEGSLYRVDDALGVRHQFNNVIIPNSIAFSPDDRTFYFSDTRRHVIWAFDFDMAEGTIADRRVFADTASHPGRPDGSTVDAEGYVWNAEIMGGRLVRYAPDGRIDRVVPLPVPRPTSCAFGGEGLRTLFVTSMSAGLDAQSLAASPLSGGLLALPMDVSGLPEPMFSHDEAPGYNQTAIGRS